MRRHRYAVTTAIAVLALSTAACSGGSGDSAASTAAHTSPGETSSAASPSPTATGHSSRSTPAAPTSTKRPKRHTARAKHDPLTGGERSKNPVVAVKLENTPAAMPQIGLSRADLVFVEEVEGGLTRLMPIYHTSFPKRVEPVRSARSTDIGILPMFGHPTLVYSGVASQVRKRLTKAPIKLVDNGTRDSRRAAPHNLYFDVQRVARRIGHRRTTDIGLRFAKHDPRVRKAPKRNSFTVGVGSDRFAFTYKGSHYLPSWNGRPYTDAGAGGKQVTAKNVLVLHVREESDNYKDPAGNPVYRSVSTGSGKLALYRNGKKLAGTWHRAAASKPFRLLGSGGKRLKLAPGKTWILLRP